MAVTRTAAQNAAEFAALTKQGKDVRLALLAACSVEKGLGDRQGDSGVAITTPEGKISQKNFAAQAGTTADRVSRHLTAWSKFAKLTGLPVAVKLVPADAIKLTITDEQAEVFAKEVTLGTSTENAIANNPKAMSEAIKNNPKVADVAAQALVDAGALNTLSSATAKAAKNKQVERNRNRLAQGTGKATTVQGPKPSPLSPDVAAFMSHHGLADALRALVTTFPAEWEALSDEAKTEDYIGACEESFDKISIALSNCRNLVAGGVSDSDIERLLDQGAS